MKILYNSYNTSRQHIQAVFSKYPLLAIELVNDSNLGNNPTEIISTMNAQNADIAILKTTALPYPLPENLQLICLQKGDKTVANNDCIALISLAGKTNLKDQFKANDLRNHYGKVTLVGFGPGSADLLTIAGEKALQNADTIFHDDLLDQEFIKKYKAKLVYVGKRKGHHSTEQDKINELVLSEAQAGKNVVRVKGGDPMIFGHGGEELEYLAANFVEATVIPGITTALALASLTHIPLTHRGISSSVAFVSGHAAQIQLPDTDTVVCYMAGYNIPNIAAKAIAQGRDPQTPVMMVHNVSLPDQQEFFYTLETLRTETRTFPTPIITIIGDVVGLKHKSEKEIVKPLYLYTGIDYTPTKKEKVRIVRQSLFELTELDDKSEINAEIKNLQSYNWLVFTSKYAVNYFFDELKNQGKDTRSLCSLKIASMGELTTKALNEKGIFPDLVPEDQSSKGLVASFINLEQNPGKVLIPRSEKAQAIIPAGLQQLGWDVKSVITYQNKMPDDMKALDLTQFAGIIFASPSCVENFIKLYGELPTNKKLISRGKVTEELLNVRVKELENRKIVHCVTN